MGSPSTSARRPRNVTSRGKQRLLTDRLGIHAEAADWCWIDKIPRPPTDVLQAAPNPRLRPAGLPPLGMVGAVLGAPFILLVMLLSLLSDAEEAVKRALGSKEEKERRRARKKDCERRDALIVQQCLDKVFDGDWGANAGQFLLRWYGLHPPPATAAHHRGRDRAGGSAAAGQRGAGEAHGDRRPTGRRRSDARRPVLR